MEKMLYMEEKWRELEYLLVECKWYANGLPIGFLMVYDIDLSSGERTKLFGAGNHILYEKELQAELPNHIESAGRLRVYCLAKLGTPLTMGFPASSYCFLDGSAGPNFGKPTYIFFTVSLEVGFL